jgi:hypothetical protein
MADPVSSGSSPAVSAGRDGGLLARLSPYEHRHLVAHLVAAGELDRMHSLLALEEPITAAAAPDLPPVSAPASGRNPLRWLVRGRPRQPASPRVPATAVVRNAWWLASEALGDPEGFLLDVRTAGQAAADDAAAALARGNQSPGVGHQLGYGLIQASLNSQVQFIPPALVPRLLGLGTWTVEEALAYVRRIPDPENRSDTLLELLPFLSGTDQNRIEPEIIASVRQITWVPSSIRHTITAAGRLRPAWQQQLLQEALDRIRSRNDADDAPELARISAQVSAEWAEALVAEAVAKASAAPDVPEASVVPDVVRHSEILGRIAVHAHPSCRDFVIGRALQAASLIPDDSDDNYGDYQDAAAEVLVMTAPYLGVRLKDAVALAESLRPPAARVQALAALLPYLPEEDRRQRLSEAVQIARSDRRRWLEPHLPVLEYLPAKQREALFKRALGKYPSSSRAIARLAPFLPAHLWPRAAECILSRHGLHEAATVAAMLRYAPEPYRDELARKVLRKLPGFKAGESGETLRVLNPLAEHCPDQLVPEIVDTLSEIGDDDARSEALTSLAPYLADKAMPIALEIARQANSGDAALLLAAVAGRLAGPELEDALAVASRLEEPAFRATALTRLSVMLPDERRTSLLRAEWDRVRSFQPDKAEAPGIQRLERGRRFQALAELYECLEGEDRAALSRDMLDLLPGLRDCSHFAASGIAVLYRWLPASLASETVSAVFAFQFPYVVIHELAPLLEPDRIREALAMTRQLDGRSKVEVMGELAPYLSGDLFDTAIEVSLAETYYQDRVSLLKSLAPYAPEAATAEMAARARDLQPPERAELLMALLPALPRRRVPAVCAEILDLVRQARARNFPAAAGPDSVVPRLLRAVPRVPEPERAEVLRAAWAAASAAGATAALKEAARCLSRPLAAVAYDELTSKSGTAQPAGPEPAVSAIRAALDRLTGLESMLPSVPEAQREHAAHIACLIHQDPPRLARELAEMSAHLSAAQTWETWSMVLAETLRIADQALRADVLAALAESAPASVARPVVTASIMAACDLAAERWDRRADRLDRAVRCIGTLPPEESHLVMSSVLSVSSARPRWVTLQVLGRLAPVVAQVSGKDGMATLVRAVQNVGRWWP